MSKGLSDQLYVQVEVEGYDIPVIECSRTSPIGNPIDIKRVVWLPETQTPSVGQMVQFIGESLDTWWKVTQVCIKLRHKDLDRSWEVRELL